MEKKDELRLIRKIHLMAIMRANSSESLISAAQALGAGGVRSIEVTMTTGNADWGI